MAFLGRDDDAYYPIVLPGLFLRGALGAQGIKAMPIVQEPAGG